MRKACVAIIIALVSSSLIDIAMATSATPVASPVAIAPDECRVELLTTDEMRQLIIAEWPRVAAQVAGTPTGNPASVSAYDQADGVPADAATVAEVTEVISQFVACTNAGRIPASAALLTEQGAGAYLSIVFLTTTTMLTQITPTTGEIDLQALNSFLGVIQVTTALPDDAQTRTISVDDVIVFDDGHIVAMVTGVTGTGEPSLGSFPLRQEDGQYRITFGDAREGGATPVASLVAN